MESAAGCLIAFPWSPDLSSSHQNSGFHPPIRKQEKVLHSYRTNSGLLWKELPSLPFAWNYDFGKSSDYSRVYDNWHYLALMLLAFLPNGEIHAFDQTRVYDFSPDSPANLCFEFGCSSCHHRSLSPVIPNHLTANRPPEVYIKT